MESQEEASQPPPRLPPSVLRQRWLELLSAQPAPRQRSVPASEDPLSPKYGSVRLPSEAGKPHGSRSLDGGAAQRLAATLRDRATKGELGPPRRLYYRRLLPATGASTSQPSNASLDFWTPADWMESLRQSRQGYARKRMEAFRAPDGGLPEWIRTAEKEEGLAQNEDDVAQSEGTNQSRFRPRAHEVGDNNPLSLEEESPWTHYLAQQAVMETIQGDVERLPDLPSPSARRSLARMLFVWCTAEHNRDVGYRQGMHELIGVLWTAVEREVIDGHPRAAPAAEDKGAAAVFDVRFIEHDTYALFEGLMTHVRAFYEWKETKPSSTPYKPPILLQCETLSASLRACDPALASHLLDTLNVEPQLFALRWFRLLFTRELGANEAYQLWDALIFSGPRMDLVPYTALALILRMRSRLLGAEQQDALGTLLNPARAMEGLKKEAGKPWPEDHVAMLVRQAARMRDSLAGVKAGDAISRSEVAQTIGRENESELGIAWTSWTPAAAEDGLDMPGGTPTFRNGGGRYAHTYAARSTTGQRRPLSDRALASHPEGQAHLATPPTPTTPGYISSLATSLYGRAESMGVVSPGVLQSVQKTVGAYAAAGAGAGTGLVGLAAARLGGGFGAEQEGRDGFPRGVQIGSSQARGTVGIGRPEPPSPVPPLTEAKKEESNAPRDRQLASALSGVIGIFESAWVAGIEKAPSDSQEALAQDQEQQLKTLAALTTLKHVRQVLAGEVEDFDPAILEGLTLVQEPSQGQLANSEGSRGSPSTSVSAPPTSAPSKPLSPQSSPGQSRPNAPSPSASSQAAARAASAVPAPASAPPALAPPAEARQTNLGPSRNARAFARAPGGDAPLMGLGSPGSTPNSLSKAGGHGSSASSVPSSAPVQRHVSPISYTDPSANRQKPPPLQRQSQGPVVDPLTAATSHVYRPTPTSAPAMTPVPAARTQPKPRVRPSPADPLGVGPL